MKRRIRILLCTIILSSLTTQPALSQPQQDSLNVIPVQSSNSASLYQEDDGWTTLTIGQSIYGVRYADPGAVIVNDTLVMSCVTDPQSVTRTGLYVSQPSRLKKFVLVLCSQYSGDQAYVIDTVHGRSVSRDAVPKHWSIFKWVGWSPDERFALVGAAGEVTMGDMAFVDLRTGEMREIHFKDLTNNPRTNRPDELQDFDPDAIVWSTASSFQVRLDVRCNPYDGDVCDYKKILSSHPVRVNLEPFSFRYGNITQARNARVKQEASVRNTQTGKGIHSVDFRNFTYQRESKSGSNIWGSPVEAKTIALNKGRNMVKGEFTDGEYGSELNRIKYVDFDGDGNDEAFVVIDTTQEVAGAYWEQDYFVFSYRNGAPVQIFHEYGYKPSGVRVTGKSIFISTPLWRENDGHCCPSSIESSIYSWRGARFVRVSRRLKPMPKN